MSGNCFILKTGSGYLLIDTARAADRAKLETALREAGCGPGDLKLTVLTHGDFDHTGNAAYLRERFGTKIAMHPADVGMVEHGDMFWNRKTPNPVLRWLIDRLGRIATFTPDLEVGEGQDLSGYAFAAWVLHLPGHSQGSIVVPTAEGDLFCGDLFTNVGRAGQASPNSTTPRSRLGPVSLAPPKRFGQAPPGGGSRAGQLGHRMRHPQLPRCPRRAEATHPDNRSEACQHCHLRAHQEVRRRRARGRGRGAWPRRCRGLLGQNSEAIASCVVRARSRPGARLRRGHPGAVL